MLYCLHTGFTSWFGGQCTGSDCATWCCAVFIRGLHLGLEDSILVFLCLLVLYCLHTGFTSWFGEQFIGSDCATWCRAVFIQGLHLGLEDRVLVLIVSLGAVLSSYRVYILVWRTGYWFWLCHLVL